LATPIVLIIPHFGKNAILTGTFDSVASSIEAKTGVLQKECSTPVFTSMDDATLSNVPVNIAFFPKCGIINTMGVAK
jgi:hypothetical protein